MSRKVYQSVTWNPVANTIASTSRSVPSTVTMPFEVTRAIPSVITSVFGFGDGLIEVVRDRIRLQPGGSVGVSFSRNSGSLM